MDVAWQCESLDTAGLDAGQKFADVLRHVLGFSQQVDGHAGLTVDGRLADTVDVPLHHLCSDLEAGESTSYRHSNRLSMPTSVHP
jgi:hypothetical protein